MLSSSKKLGKLILLLFLMSSFSRADDNDHDPGSKVRHRSRRGRSRETDDDNAEDGTKTSKSNCVGTRHPSFVMPTVDSREAVDSNAGKVAEIRINKYYAVRRDKFYIKNTGLGLEFQLQLEPEKREARIRGADWDDEYVLEKGVFHWQLKNLTVKNPDGTITFNTNSTDPPLEMELVHYAKRHGSLEAAAKFPGGVLILGILFELVGKDNTALEPIARSTLTTTFPNEKFKQSHGPLDLKSLFPSELQYSEFSGLYPMNPCANEARFIVFQNPLLVSARQLKRFGDLRTEDGQKISDHMLMQPPSSALEYKQPRSSKTYLTVVGKLGLPASAPKFSPFSLLFFIWIKYCIQLFIYNTFYTASLL